MWGALLEILPRVPSCLGMPLTEASLKNLNSSFHHTCIVQIIPSQFKHPQVHVGDGVKGAAGQQDHGGYFWVLHGSSRRAGISLQRQQQQT